MKHITPHHSTSLPYPPLMCIHHSCIPTSCHPKVGSVNIKNTKNILTKNIVNICVSLLTWWAVGYALTYGDSKSGVLGTSHFFVGCDEYPELATASSMPLAQAPAMDEDLSFVLFQWGFASTCATIVSGAVAERIKVEAFAVNTFFMVGIIYPLVAHAVWSRDGWAQITRGDNEWGVIDFAGSGVVHMTGPCNPPCPW
jgi:Amt family ammonium transporter